MSLGWRCKSVTTHSCGKYLLSFMRNCQLFAWLVASFYIPTSIAWEIQSLYFFPIMWNYNWFKEIFLLLLLIISVQQDITFLTCKHICVCVKSLQSCVTLCDPMDCSLPGSSVHRILQARLLEWVAISCFGGSSRPRDQTVCLLHWQAGSLPLAPPRKPQQAHLSAHKSGNGLNIYKVTCPL